MTVTTYTEAGESGSSDPYITVSDSNGDADDGVDLGAIDDVAYKASPQQIEDDKENVEDAQEGLDVAVAAFALVDVAVLAGAAATVGVALGAAPWAVGMAFATMMLAQSHLDHQQNILARDEGQIP